MADKRVFVHNGRRCEAWSEKDTRGRLFMRVRCPETSQRTAAILPNGPDYQVDSPGAGFLGGFSTSDLRLAMAVAAGMVAREPIQSSLNWELERRIASQLKRMQKFDPSPPQKPESKILGAEATGRIIDEGNPPAREEDDA